MKFLIWTRPVAAWFVYWLFKLGILRTWYRLYRELYERKHFDPDSPEFTHLARYHTIAELVAEIGKAKWRADKLKELWDAISHPSAIQYRLNTDPDKAIGDCDEFAVYSAAVINNESKLLNELGAVRAYIMSVMWIKTGGKTWAGNSLGYGGHNVCVIQLINGKFKWMDYSIPTNADSLNDVASQVRDMYATQYYTLGWALQDAMTLKLISVSRD